MGASNKATYTTFKSSRCNNQGYSNRSGTSSAALGLPSSQMLNASVRGIRQIETAEDKLNTERAESVARLRELDRLEESRARRAKKLQGIGDYNKPATELQPAKGGGKGFLDQLSNPSSKLGSAVIGGGFPALMGGGSGHHTRRCFRRRSRRLCRFYCCFCYRSSL